MSTKYFLLTKSADKSLSNNEDNQIIFPNSNLTYILPETNLTYYHSRGLFENSLIEWSKQFCSKNGIFLDIGAHTGTYAISLAESCKAAYAFEPQKMTYYALCGSVALSNKPNISCFQVALGSPEQIGKMKLKIRSNDGGGSSICDIDGVISEEVVYVQTLDAFMKSREDIDNHRIEFIKLDVEYNELNVLKGAVETLELNNYPTIIFEANTDSNMNKDLFYFLENQLCYKIVNINGYKNMFLAVYDKDRVKKDITSGVTGNVEEENVKIIIDP